MKSRAVASLVACVAFVWISHGTARSAELKIFASRAIWTVLAEWPAPGSEDTELGVLLELEVGHGETEVYAGVQA
jgi:hypothetical protein